MAMNKIFASGRLTADPENRAYNGTPVTTFTLACDTRTKDPSGGFFTNFYRCTVWRNLAETCAKYLHKGDKLEVVGDLTFRTYTDTKGAQRYSLDINVTDVGFNFAKREESAPVTQQAPNPVAAPMPGSEDDLPF